MKREVAIIGAGLCGLTAAYELVKNPELKVRIYEGSTDIGGMARSLEYRGCIFDYGVHFFHMHDSEARKLIMNQLEGNLYRREFFAKLYAKNTFYNYPPRMPSVDLSEKIVTNVKKSVQSFVEEESFEEWARLRMGDEYYHTYFKEYTEKWWGIPPNRLSAELIKAVFSSLLKGGKVIKWYPVKGGIGILSKELARRISPQAEILLDHKLVGVETRDNRITSLVFETAETRVVKNVDLVISTIPITELGRLLNISPRGLRFRSLIFLFLIVKKTNVLNSDWIHFSPSEIMISRVYEPKRFSIYNCPKNMSCLAVEIPCSQGDRIWNMSDNRLKDHVLNNLEEVGIISSKDVIDCRIRKLAYSHPIYYIGYKRSVGDLREDISRYENLSTYGRLGGYQYATMDMAIKAGFDVAKNNVNFLAHVTPNGEKTISPFYL